MMRGLGVRMMLVTMMVMTVPTPTMITTVVEVLEWS
jgi:hypothetical protein